MDESDPVIVQFGAPVSYIRQFAQWLLCKMAAYALRVHTYADNTHTDIGCVAVVGDIPVQVTIRVNPYEIAAYVDGRFAYVITDIADPDAADRAFAWLDSFTAKVHLVSRQLV
jgi:hypothetical protein